MRPARILLSLLFVACSESPLPPGSGDGGAPDRPADLAAPAEDLTVPPDLTSPADLNAPDLGAGCIGLLECDCLNRMDCQPISGPCWCPFPQCGPGSCICSGGAFLGCAPPASQCQRSVSCQPPQHPTGPDAMGCFYCG